MRAVDAIGNQLRIDIVGLTADAVGDEPGNRVCREIAHRERAPRLARLFNGVWRGLAEPQATSSGRATSRASTAPHRVWTTSRR